MPYAPHYRLTCSGRIGIDPAAGEEFSFGLALAEYPFGPIFDVESGSGSVGGMVSLNQDQRDDVVADCVALFARPGTFLGAYSVLTQVKLASIGADGKYTADPFIAEVNQAGGTSGGVVYPPQVALAVSLTTERRGASGRGRFFLPPPVINVDQNTMMIADANRDSIATSCAQFLNDLNNEPGIDSVGLRVVVASTKGFNSLVTGVRVGRTLDTIRSRRRSLSEDYSAPVDLLPLADE